MPAPALIPNSPRQQAAFAALLGPSSKDQQPRPALPQALLLQGNLEPGANASPFTLGWALAAASLCETPSQDNTACGHCAACLLMQAQTHPDFLLLAPETVLREIDWLDTHTRSDTTDNKKRKPSKEIRMENLLECIAFAQQSAARAYGKVVLIYPAEAMNAISANALLKTLEEPPPGLYFILASLHPHQLLPTVKSRCQCFRIDMPNLGNLEDTLPQASELPKALAAGQTNVFADCSPQLAAQHCLRLCHDLMCVCSADSPRFFRAQDLPRTPSIQQLARWYRQLMQAMQSIEHPYREDLLKEYLITLAQQAMNKPSRKL